MNTMTSKTKQVIYGLFAILGLATTWYYNIQFMLANEGFSAVKFITDNYVNAASASISNDITVVAFCFFFWSYFEAKRLNIRYWWLYCLFTFLIALAVMLPLFMLARERRLQHTTAPQ